MCSTKSVVTTIVVLGVLGVLAYFIMQSDMMKKQAGTETVEIVEMETRLDADADIEEISADLMSLAQSVDADGVEVQDAAVL